MEFYSVQQQIRYGSIVSLTKRNDISKFHNIFVCVNCVCYECYACGHIRIHTKRMHDCMQAPAMHPLENFKKVLPMLSHFLFQNFSLLARNVDRNVPDIAVRCSFIATLDNYVWSAYCHQSEIKIIYHDLGGSVFFLKYYHCLLLQLICYTINVKTKYYESKAHHTTQCKRNKANEVRNHLEKDKSKLHTHRISMFSLCRRVCVVFCCVLPFVYTKKANE